MTETSKQFSGCWKNAQEKEVVHYQLAVADPPACSAAAAAAEPLATVAAAVVSLQRPQQLPPEVLLQPQQSLLLLLQVCNGSSNCLQKFCCSRSRASLAFVI
jgi:hypothetical protein